MQVLYRLYRRANGTFYAQSVQTGERSSLKTKSKAEALQLLAARNQAQSQPALNREMARVYLIGQDPEFCRRTWADVVAEIERGYDGVTHRRWGKFYRSAPIQKLLRKELYQTTSTDLLEVLRHPRAGVSTNVQLRILHNRALGIGWLLAPVLPKKGWPPVRFKKRRGITEEEHRRIVAVTGRDDYRLYFELLWEIGGSQTDVANLRVGDIDWTHRRLFYQRGKLEGRDIGRAAIVIGDRIEAILKKLPASGYLFPALQWLGEDERASYFRKKRIKAGVADGIVLHCYRYAWAERAYEAGMPEREAQAHLGHGSRAVHRAYAKAGTAVTLPLEYYEQLKERKIVDAAIVFRQAGTPSSESGARAASPSSA